MCVSTTGNKQKKTSASEKEDRHLRTKNLRLKFKYFYTILHLIYIFRLLQKAELSSDYIYKEEAHFMLEMRENEKAEYNSTEFTTILDKK